MPMLSKEERKHLDDLIVKIKEGDREALEEFVHKFDEYSKMYELNEYVVKLEETGKVLLDGNMVEFY